MIKFTKSSKTIPAQLSQLNTKCAGIDVGASELFVCIAKDSSNQEVRSFSTFTADIKDMIKWLKENNVESVAMESTGVYWIPPYELLEEEKFEVLLVNACFFKAVPGRKSDVQDCQWIQQLHSYGLLRGSFRPDDDFVVLRSYVRQRSRLFQSAATQIQLIQKAFVQMNIQLNNVISDITGLTGLNIIKAILAGERDPYALANLSVGGCRKKYILIAKSLEGNYRKEHLFSLEMAYQAYEFFHQQIQACEEMILQILTSIQDKRLIVKDSVCTQDQKKNPQKKRYNRSPYHFNATDEIKKLTKVDLTTIPGIQENIAMTIISEVGTDMSRFRNEKAFASWASLCPGNKVSGGKVISSKTKRSNNRLAQALRMAAMSLLHSDTYLGAYARRMRARLGGPKSITATAHKLAKIIYAMLSTGETYKELGENYYEQKHQARVLSNLKRHAEKLGYSLVSTEIKEV